VTSQGAFLSRLTLNIQGIWDVHKQEPNFDHRIQVQELRSPRPPWSEREYEVEPHTKTVFPRLPVTFGWRLLHGLGEGKVAQYGGNALLALMLRSWNGP
jgi:hypothetical protein